MHICGLIISLWGPANSLYLRDKCVMQTGNRLQAGYYKNGVTYSKYHWTPQLVVNNTFFWTTQFTFKCNFLWFKRNLYIEHFDTPDTDLSFIFVSNRICTVSIDVG